MPAIGIMPNNVVAVRVLAWINIYIFYFFVGTILVLGPVSNWLKRHEEDQSLVCGPGKPDFFCAANTLVTAGMWHRKYHQQNFALFYRYVAVLCVFRYRYHSTRHWVENTMRASTMQGYESVGLEKTKRCDKTYIPKIYTCNGITRRPFKCVYHVLFFLRFSIHGQCL